MSNDPIRAALKRLVQLVDEDMLCPSNPAETDWDAVAGAIAYARDAQAAVPEKSDEPSLTLTIDLLTEDRVKSLVELVAAAITPNGGYELGEGIRDGAQIVNGEWWQPEYGCDSLEMTLHRIKARLASAIGSWYASCFKVTPGKSPAALDAVPEGESSDDELLSLDDLRDAWNAHADAVNSWDELGVDVIAWWAQSQALARWGRPATPPAVTIGALLHPAYEHGDADADGAQLVDMEWWRPVMGCDSLQTVVDNARDNARNILNSRWGRPTTTPAGQEGMNWQPIATAPLDQLILLYRPGSHYSWTRIDIGRFDDDHYAKKPRPFWRSMAGLLGITQMRDWKPSHWQPLPLPPAGQEGADA